MPVMRWAVDASLSTGATGCIKYNSLQCTRHHTLCFSRSRFIWATRGKWACLSLLLLLWWRWWRWWWLLWLWLNTLLSYQPPPWTTSLPHLKSRQMCMPKPSQAKPRESKWFIILLTKSCFFIIIISVFGLRLKIQGTQPIHVMCSYFFFHFLPPPQQQKTSFSPQSSA